MQIFVDYGLTGRHAATAPDYARHSRRAGPGDALVVTKLDRLARSLPGARDVAGDLTRKGAALNLGGSVGDPTDPVGKLLFSMLGMVPSSRPT